VIFGERRGLSAWAMACRNCENAITVDLRVLDDVKGFETARFAWRGKKFLHIGCVV
jgi:hypothetical protein